jgi:hypothetical protein
MKQPTGNATRGSDAHCFGALTGAGFSSYFVPTTHAAVEQMSVLIFGRKRSRSVSVQGREQRLDCAAQIGLGERMHAWRRRPASAMWFAVYPPEAAPDYEDAVVLHIAQGLRLPPHSSKSSTIRTASSRSLATRTAVHVHLMARGPAARAALIADLLA